MSMVVHVAETIHDGGVGDDVRLHVASHGFAVSGFVIEMVACFPVGGPDGKGQEAKCKPVQGSGKSHGYQVVNGTGLLWAVGFRRVNRKKVNRSAKAGAV